MIDIQPILSTTITLPAPTGSVRINQEPIASLQLSDALSVIYSRPDDLRRLAAVARRLAFAMEAADETGQVPGGRLEVTS